MGSRTAISFYFHGFSNQQVHRSYHPTYFCLSDFDSQWILESAAEGTDLYYIRNGDGVYLTYSGPVRSELPIICTNDKQPFRILVDPRDNGRYK